jgi:hypothetical protein
MKAGGSKSGELGDPGLVSDHGFGETADAMGCEHGRFGSGCWFWDRKMPFWTDALRRFPKGLYFVEIATSKSELGSQERLHP